MNVQGIRLDCLQQLPSAYAARLRCIMISHTKCSIANSISRAVSNQHGAFVAEFLGLR